MRDHERELSEIDEEIIQYVLLLIVRQAEAAWHLPEQSLISERRVKSGLLNQFFPANEKVTVVNFEMMIAEKPSLVSTGLPHRVCRIPDEADKARSAAKERRGPPLPNTSNS